MGLLSMLSNSGNGEGSSQAALATELERLLRDAGDERRTLEAIVASAQTRATEVPQMSASFDDMGRRATELVQRLDGLAARIDGLETVQHRLHPLDERVAALEGGVHEVEGRLQQTLSHEAEVDRRRDALEQLLSLARETLGATDALKHDRAALAELEELLPRLRTEVRPLFDQQDALKAELDRLRIGLATVSQDAETSREASLKARAHATKATETVTDLLHKLEPLTQLQSLGQDTAAQLRALNTLAEHVAVKVKALEGQQQVVDHALLESRRVNEMVWDVEVQINKLTEGAQLATRVEETLRTLENLHAGTTARVEAATIARQEFGRQVALHEREANTLVEGLRGHVERLAADKRELETVNERLRTLQASLADGEARVDALAAREPVLVQLGERAERLSTEMEDLRTQTDGLERRQAALSTLEDRLTALEILAQRTNSHFESLSQSRTDLEQLRNELNGVHALYEQTATLLGGFRVDKQEYGRLLERSAEFQGQTSQVAARVDALAAHITEVEANAARVTGMATTVDDLATKLHALMPRLQAVETLDAQLHALHTLSTDVDRRLGEQLARRAELESLKVLCDGVATQVTDTQEKLTTVNAVQTQLGPVRAQLSGLETDLDRVRSEVHALQRGRETLAAQERQMADLVDASRTLAQDIAHRQEVVEALQADLGRAGAMKAQLLSELAQIQSQQRDTCTRIEAADDQLTRLDALWKQFEQRRGQLAEAEQKMARVDNRLGQLQQLSDEVDRKTQAIAGREQLVDAVKREVEAIHTLGVKNHADLAAIAERRTEITETKSEIDRFGASLANTREQLAVIESRRPIVDEVARTADMITHVLEDMRITLDSLGEQKAMVDHVFGEFARLEYLVQEARGTMRTLQAERDVAQRIAENVRQLHARVASDSARSA